MPIPRQLAGPRGLSWRMRQSRYAEADKSKGPVIPETSQQVDSNLAVVIARPLRDGQDNASTM